MQDQQGKQQISFDKTVEVKCNNCNGITFREVTVLRKIPKFIANTQHDQFIPMNILKCDDCGQIHHETLPSELKSYFNSSQKEKNNDN